MDFERKVFSDLLSALPNQVEDCELRSGRAQKTLWFYFCCY
jgi:hypothetical protein